MSRTAPLRRITATTAVLLAVAPWSLAAVPAPITSVPAADGGEVVLAPAVQRATGDTATVTVTLGPEAADDLWVVGSVHDAVTDRTGAVQGAPARTAGRAGRPLTAPVRLRPGEGTTLRVTLPEAAGALVVRVTARPADTPTATGVHLEALVLHGPPPAGPPAVALTPGVDGRSVATVTSDAPTLVNLRVVGRERLDASQRLVLPGDGLRLDVDAAPWPLPTVLLVTDELGRTVRASVGDTATAAVAAALLLVTIVVLAVAARAHRRHRTASTASLRDVDV